MRHQTINSLHHGIATSVKMHHPDCGNKQLFLNILATKFVLLSKDCCVIILFIQEKVMP